MKYWANLLWVLLAAQAAAADNPLVELQTNHGSIVLELDQRKAPRTVENFLGYARAGFYDGTVFHRVIPDYMIQGGGYTTDYQKKPTHEPVHSEAGNGLKNKKGTVAMSRGSDPSSATSQFFINLADNEALDYKGAGTGYTVFGKVVKGLDVAEAIQEVETGEAGPFSRNAPVEAVIIEKVVIQRDLPEGTAAMPKAAAPATAAKPEAAPPAKEAAKPAKPATAKAPPKKVETAPDLAKQSDNGNAEEAPDTQLGALSKPAIPSEYAPELPDVPAVE